MVTIKEKSKQMLNGRTSDGCLLQDENKIHLPNLVADHHKKIWDCDWKWFNSVCLEVHF